MPKQFEQLERGIDKFFRILSDIFWMVIVTTIITGLTWSVLIAISDWMERY